LEERKEMNFREKKEAALDGMAKQWARRAEARERLIATIAAEATRVGKAMPPENELRAAADARMGKDWATAAPTGDYVFARDEASLYTQLETAALLRTTVVQNRRIIELLEALVTREEPEETSYITPPTEWPNPDYRD
jgi:hypothetical protein